jgi:hypothetical protein
MFRSFLRCAFAAAPLALALFASGAADASEPVQPTAIPTSGADLHIHNKTGVDVELYIFEDDKVHRAKSGGVHAGDLHDGETGTAHVKACHFAVVLFHGSDAYHAEFHDCTITDITITASNKR